MENKLCTNCSQNFNIEPEDFDFYQKVQVPPPTQCPVCRCIRRMVHRNERNLYRRKCDITGKDIISIYRPDSPFTVVDREYFFSDAFDPMVYGTDFDFSRPFFDQFLEFVRKVPVPSLYVQASQNCDYNQDMSRSANCYLCSRTHDSQNMLYTYRGNKSSYCTDCFQVKEQSEYLYECFDTNASNNSKFLHNCEKCSESLFLYNCSGCVNCFMCTDLRGKQYCFKNEQYSREEYTAIVAKYNLATYSGQKAALKEFEEFILKYPRKHLSVLRSVNVSNSDFVKDSKNCRHSYNIKKCEDCAYLWDQMDYSNSMDAYSGGRNSSLVYEATSTTAANNCKFTVRAADSRDCLYSWFLKNCSNCFACSGLSNKEYCILNKQYTKEEYTELRDKIIAHMQKEGEYGEYFPISFSPFPYNDTVAQEYFPKTKEEALSSGFTWVDPAEKSYVPTLQIDSIPEHIADVTDAILKETVACEDIGNCTHGCTKAFRITKDELEFYRRMKIPVPRKCPNCRYYRRLAYRNPTTIREIVCMCDGTTSTNGVYKNNSEHEHGSGSCAKPIETSFAEGTKTIIYCEACYRKEVF
jgi:hypothetical protein